MASRIGFVLHLSESPSRLDNGVEVRTVLPREASEVTKSEAILLPPGAATAERTHPDEEEVYLVIAGRGEVILDGVPHAVQCRSFAWVPRGCPHFVRAAPDSSLEYVYVAVFPDEADHG